MNVCDTLAFFEARLSFRSPMLKIVSGVDALLEGAGPKLKWLQGVGSKATQQWLRSDFAHAVSVIFWVTFGPLPQSDFWVEVTLQLFGNLGPSRIANLPDLAQSPKSGKSGNSIFRVQNYRFSPLSWNPLNGHFRALNSPLNNNIAVPRKGGNEMPEKSYSNGPPRQGRKRVSLHSDNGISQSSRFWVL